MNGVEMATTKKSARRSETFPWKGQETGFALRLGSQNCHRFLPAAFTSLMQFPLHRGGIGGGSDGTSPLLCNA